MRASGCPVAGRALAVRLDVLAAFDGDTQEIKAVLKEVGEKVTAFNTADHVVCIVSHA